MRASVWFLTACLVLPTLGCAWTQTTWTPLPAPPASAEGALGAGDALEIRVLQEVEISGDYQVDASGNVGFPYIGVVAAKGLTPGQLAAEIKDRLLQGGFFREPVVTVLVREFNSRLVHVLGSVKAPGAYRYTDGMGVIDAISAAGGVLETGQANGTTVTRKVDGVDYRVQVPVTRVVNGRQADQPLAVGDIVFVPESPI